MKKTITHRTKSKPYSVPKTYNHKGDHSSKGVGMHATSGPQSKKKK